MHILWIALTDNMHYDNNFRYYCKDVVYCIRSCSEGNESVADGSVQTPNRNWNWWSIKQTWCVAEVFPPSTTDLMLSAFILNILLLWRRYIDSIRWCLHFYRLYDSLVVKTVHLMILSESNDTNDAFIFFSTSSGSEKHNTSINTFRKKILFSLRETVFTNR